MSVETTHPVVEETVVPKSLPTTEQPEVSAPKTTETPAVAEATVAAAITSEDSAPAPATENPTVEGNAVVGAVPASEGTLGYKEHGFLKSFRYSKHFFWFGEEPSTAESLSHYTKSEKGEHVHHAAAWAQETGNGVLFYTKRAEDKATPAGVILLTDASTVLKEGTSEFSFTVGKIHHRFQAITSTERDSWIVALEKKIEESKGLKEEVTARESYKKTLEGFTVVSPTPIAARSSSKGPRKIVDAAPATTAASEPIAPVAPVTPVANAETASTSSSDVEKKAKKEAEKNAKKERSQSRKRTSIFGMLSKKDDEKDLKKEEKAEKKAEKESEKEHKKIEKEHIKEEKKAEAEIKKEEAKATHDSNKAVEAAEAATVAAVPAAAIFATDKKEEKKEDEITTPTEKKNKRASVFGSIFGKKGVTSPTAEKTEKEATAATASTQEAETLPVSETAPKLDEPIVNKPIDTAAVTAPVDAVETPTPATTTIPTEESAKETTAIPATESATSPKTEKKGGFLAGLMKKAEIKKEEKKEEKEEVQEEKAAEQISKDPIAAAAAPATTGATEAATETPATEVTEAKDERPAREKRRTSFFSALGTIKKKNTETTDAEGASEVKREKSPLPSKLGGMFRKPSKAVKPSEAGKPVETATTEPETVKADGIETPVTNTTEAGESKIVGDVVPDELHAAVHNAVTINPSEATEIKASA